MIPFKEGERYSAEFHLSPAVYNGFLTTFLDRNPLHTDAIFAQGKGFKGKVMHGNILCGFLSYFIGECLPTKQVIIHKQEIKFIKPVYEDDHLHFLTTVSGVHEAVSAFQFKFQFLRKSEKVASGNFQIGVL